MDKKYIIIAWPKDDLSKIRVTHAYGKDAKDEGPMFFENRGKAYKLLNVIQSGWDYMLIEIKGEIDHFLSLSSEEYAKLTKLED